MKKVREKYWIVAIIVLISLVWHVAPGNGENQGEEKLKVLPEPKTKGSISVEEAISKRRSVRSFSGVPLTDEELSQLLWSAQGITEKKRKFRAAPSAGATYPLETYIVTAEGIFHYLPEKHALEEVKKGDFRKDLSGAALNQRWVRTAPAIIVFAAVLERTTRRYGKRGNMYIHMEAGHAAENVHLQAVALGLGSVPVGAFKDDEVAKVIGLSDREKPLYLVPVGK